MTWTLVEPYAGLGAYSLWAVSRSRPPVSRMGSKAGFAPGVFRAWGLAQARWGGVWLNDMSIVCGLLHRLYASADLQAAVARRLWAWVPCPVCCPDRVQAALDGARVEPATLTGRDGCEECTGTGVQDARRLWCRLRSEPVPDGLVDAVAVAVGIQSAAWGGLDLVVRGGRWGMMRATRASSVTFDGVVPSLAVLANAVASSIYLQSRSFSLKPIGLDGGLWLTHGFKPEVDTYVRVKSSSPMHEDSPRWALAERITSLPPMPGIRLTQQDAGLCLPTGPADNTLVILDPPYEGTTGYQHSSSRETVLALARAWHAAGALVIIHEACGLADDLGSPWVERRAGALRRGASNLWTDGVEREWITASIPPVWWPAQQQGLFG